MAKPLGFGQSPGYLPRTRDKRPRARIEQIRIQRSVLGEPNVISAKDTRPQQRSETSDDDPTPSTHAYTWPALRQNRPFHETNIEQ